MKIRSSFLALSVASFLFSTSLAPQPAVLAAEDTELETHMKAINKGTKSLRRMLEDVAQKDTALALLVELEGHALAAKLLVPQRLAEAAEDDKADFMLGFRSGIIGLISGMLEVELAVLEERQDDAVESFKSLLKLRNASHKKFKIKKEKEKK